MSEEREECISAMLDNELDSQSEPIVDDLLRSASLKDRWARYNLISDVLNKQMPESMDFNLADRISADIQNEPTVLAPRASATQNLLKPVAGFAIAASVAAMAILGIQQNNENIETASPQTVSFTPQAKLNAMPLAQLVSSNSEAEAQVKLANANRRAKLNSYLVNHNESRINSGFQGMQPYVRTVTFENDK
jgi:sigma-E factor negative regulatory protein RseA